MFKKRTVKTKPRKKEASQEPEVLGDSRDASQYDNEEEKVDLQDLLAIRRLQRPKQGIDYTKLNQGAPQKRRKPKEEPTYGLQPRKGDTHQDDDDDPDDEESKARKIVRSNNFTQQTNALDVDKHMMAYIEENMKKRGAGRDLDDELEDEKPHDPQEALFKFDEKYRAKPKTLEEEGNVTNSLAMLTAIPEVDLGMDVRLRNIEETEKAKRHVAEQRRARFHQGQHNEPDLGSTRFFRPNQHPQESDAEALRRARLEAQGIHVEPETKRPKNDRRDVATDEQAMERFKKRMRR
ncbi:hepatocellular carcinoma-associated antigen 59-domain-containing protein [Cantharellus anzutake]|uniref:hepatocellular carcinoma-associated antigen 59-domain-containing protein n=1 Tax=Cantharellus anzutake TaxID=1750568 RepID=UPI00190625C5|nr:hepatocellular carcinoma-associated antigen 59-domain-containing protein [Cantharellus anzutake]KAF8313155.1 hepatocellular carcinoma-associated antigen 59-domain-containing protein [Cantharellus anzutake]